MPDESPERRFARRRHRGSRSQVPPEPAPAAAEDAPPVDRPRRADPTERMWRDLAGAGPSRVGVDGALRARDVNRPTAEDLRAAEEEVRIVRRHWTPPPDADGPPG